MSILLSEVLLFMVLNGCAPIDISPIYSDECARIVKLSHSGDHKAAVDMIDKLEKYGMTCSAEVLEMTAISRDKLEQANDYVAKALVFKKEGDLLSARENMQCALKIYPKYYWVKELLKNVETSIEKQETATQNDAPSLELELKPKEVEDLGEQPSKHDSTTERDDYTHRQNVIRQGLYAAQKAEQDGELDEAARYMIKTTELSFPEEPLTKEIVEYARLLGVKFFSTGNYSKAKALWQGALKLSPGNSELQQYLKEVNARLVNLQKIKKEENRQPYQD